MKSLQEYEKLTYFYSQKSADAITIKEIVIIAPKSLKSFLKEKNQ